MKTGNIFGALPREAPEEKITALVTTPQLRVESIVSHGHVTPEGTWYDQDWTEWVVVVKGTAELLFEHESAPRVLKPGDHVEIPAHARHRVTATDPHEETVWLAVHYPPFTDR
jgi:cupin 2 domain-containing protein